MSFILSLFKIRCFYYISNIIILSNLGYISLSRDKNYYIGLIEYNIFNIKPTTITS